MSWIDRLSRVRRCGFFQTLRGSLLELLDEVLVFVGLLAAIFVGLYYGSWWIFVGVMLLAFLLSVLARWVLGGRERSS